jgi:hypothetical protein
MKMDGEKQVPKTKEEEGNNRDETKHDGREREVEKKESSKERTS